MVLCCFFIYKKKYIFERESNKNFPQLMHKIISVIFLPRVVIKLAGLKLKSLNVGHYTFNI